MPEPETVYAPYTPSRHSAGTIYAPFAAALLAAWAVARLLAPLWPANAAALHTATEAISIVMSLAIFMVAWLTFDMGSAIPPIVGFGYLAAAIFDAGHAALYPGLPFGATSPEMSVRYWMAARLTEAAVLLLAYGLKIRRPISRCAGLAVTLTTSLGISCLLYVFPAAPPLFIADRNATALKIVLELIVIISLLLTVAAVRERPVGAPDDSRCLCLALLLAAAAECCFTLYIGTVSFYGVFGHVLLAGQRCCLFRGIFAAAVIYPYRMLRRERRHYRDIYNGLPVGIVTFSPDFVASYANRAALEMLGCRTQDIVGLTLEAAMERLEPPDAGNRPITREELTGEGLPRGEIRIVAGGAGKERKVELNVRRLAHGRLAFMYSDVSAEQELAVLQQQTQAILNSVPNLILLLDRDGRILMCNEALSAAGMAADRIAGMPIADFLSWCGYRRRDLTRDGAKAAENAALYEATGKAPEGAPRTLLAQESEIRNIDREVIGRIVVATDLTEMQRAQEQAKQQEKLAVIGQMAAGIVHEIRNPLTAIKGFNYLIRSTAADEVIQDYAATVEAEINNMNKVVTDFLAFARPRPPQLEEVSLNGIVESLATMLEGQTFIRNIRFITHLTKTEKTVLADAGQLKQIILNIAQNGMDAMAGAAAPLLTVGTALSAQADEMLLFITDNGAGLTPEAKTKLGTPFFTTKAKGTGLGLSICYQIIEEHNGRIEVESEPGRGTSFLIYLPVRTE